MQLITRLAHKVGFGVGDGKWIKMAKKLMLIDTDCGIDDAQAIMVALAHPHVKVLGISCCFGNTTVDNVCQNVARVLDVCARNEVPIFKGSAGPLLGALNTWRDHFGTDGLGDVLDTNCPVGWKDRIQTEDAVTAMIRLVSDNPGQVSLVAVGPLTNLALAVRLDPDFPKKLKELFIMGGNTEGKGNVSVCGEFNFFLDPESAYVVLEEYCCPTHIATWEYTCRNQLSWDFFEKMVSQDYAAARFMKTISSKCWAFSREFGVNKRDVLFGQGFVPYDAYAVAACIEPSVVTESVECAVRVELQGSLGRGMMAMDPTNMLKKSHKVCIMKTCDQERFGELLMASLRQPTKSNK